MWESNNPRQLRTMKDHQIVGLGEVLWDIFPDGEQFGGAPANFACSTAGLARGRAEVFLVSSVGQDELGDRAIAALQEKSVATTHVTRQDRPTGAVHVTLDANGQAKYEFAKDAAWDHLRWSDGLSQLAARTDAVCFGTLGQRNGVSREAILRFLKATRPTCLRVFDVNLRPPFYDDEIISNSLAVANVLKLNEDELPILARIYKLSGTRISLLQQLADRFELLAVALTCGPEGAVLIRGDQVSQHPGLKTTVVDTVGAGDAFTATSVLGLLDGEQLDAINRRACEVAVFVCSQAGATPAIPATFD